MYIVSFLNSKAVSKDLREIINSGCGVVLEKELLYRNN